MLTLSNASTVVPRSQAPLGVIASELELRSTVPSRFFPMDFGMIVV